MMVLLGITLLIFVVGGLAIYAEKSGKEVPVPEWLIFVLMAAWFGWALYRSLWAKPRCPGCGSRSVDRQALWSDPEDDPSRSTTHRRYLCRRCGADIVVPHLSIE